MTDPRTRRLRTYAAFFVIVVIVWLLLSVTLFDESFGLRTVLVALGFGAFATAVVARDTERRRPGGQSPRES